MSELMDVPLVHIYIVIGCLYLAPQCCSSGKGRRKDLGKLWTRQWALLSSTVNCDEWEKREKEAMKLKRLSE